MKMVYSQKKFPARLSSKTKSQIDSLNIIGQSQCEIRTFTPPIYFSQNPETHEINTPRSNNFMSVLVEL